MGAGKTLDSLKTYGAEDVANLSYLGKCKTPATGPVLQVFTQGVRSMTCGKIFDWFNILKSGPSFFAKSSVLWCGTYDRDFSD